MRLIVRGLVVAALILVVAGGWFAVHNPSVSVRPGDGYPGWGDEDYTCLAPYDVVLNDADNTPGGEPPPGAERIKGDCDRAARRSFTVATMSLGSGVLLGITAAVLWGSPLRRRHRT